MYLEVSYILHVCQLQHGLCLSSFGHVMETLSCIHCVLLLLTKPHSKLGFTCIFCIVVAIHNFSESQDSEDLRRSVLLVPVDALDFFLPHNNRRRSLVSASLFASSCYARSIAEGSIPQNVSWVLGYIGWSLQNSHAYINFDASYIGCYPVWANHHPEMDCLVDFRFTFLLLTVVPLSLLICLCALLLVLIQLWRTHRHILVSGTINVMHVVHVVRVVSAFYCIAVLL